MSSLLKFKEVVSAFEPIGNYATTELREFMRNNVNQVNSKYLMKSKYEYARDSETNHAWLKSTTLTGRKWSQHIAQLKKGAIDEMFYLDCLHHTNSNIAMRIEPKLFEVRQKMNNGEWSEIPIKEYLKTLIQNRGESVRYDEIIGKYEHFQKLHNLHESINEPMLVAYYPSIDYMRKGREVRTKFGKYLTQFANEFGIDGSIVKELSEIHSARILARKGWQVHFIESNDEQGWLDVYGSGVGSCMQGKSCVRVYAHEKSVLRLAHIKTNEGTTLARCIVRDDKKEWVRVYPDPNGYAEGRHLKQSLETLGYTFGNLNGVLLQAIPSNDYSGHYVMPYVDYGNSGEQSGDLIHIEGKDYIEVGGNGDYILNNTNGTTYDPESDDEANYCDDCGGHFSDDEGNYSDYHGVWICEGCQDNYAWAITNHNDDRDLIHLDDCIFCETDNEYYLDNSTLLERCDIRYCDESSAYYHVDEMKLTSQGFVHENEVTIVDYLHEGEFDCVVNSQVHELSNGKLCHINDADELQAEIDFNESQEVLNLACEVAHHE